jgi:DNA invertase Pin-like site-specific DNA recombinase
MGTGQGTQQGAAIIYCRVSTKRQEDEGTSLDSQEAACVTHAQTLGFTSWRVTREVYRVTSGMDTVGKFMAS